MVRKHHTPSWLALGATCVLCLQPPAAGAQAQRSVGELVAQAGGQSLTRAELDQLLTLYDWLLETPLTLAERASMTAVLVREFQADPAKAAKNYAALRQQLPQILAMSPTHQARRRSELLKAVAQARRNDPYMAEVLKLLSRGTSVLAVSDADVLTRHQVDAMIACDDNVAEVAGLPRAGQAERARITADVTRAFPGLNPKADAFEAVADAEERCLALRDFVQASPKNHDAVVAGVHAKVHGPGDVPGVARKLENNALMLSRMQTFAQQQKMISGVIAINQGQLNALRAASNSFTWHESRAYAHGQPKPGGPSGFGPQ